MKTQLSNTAIEIANALPVPAPLDFRQAMQAIGGSDLMEYFEHTDDPKAIIIQKVMDAYELNPVEDVVLTICLKHINSLQYIPELIIAGQISPSHTYAY